MKAILVAITFLTRLPIDPGPVDPPLLGRSTGFYPIAGALIAMITLMISSGALMLWDRPVAAILGVVFLIALPGGLHLDGLADCLDGWLCGGDAARRRAVMHDPRVGALASGGISLFLGLSVTFLHLCMERASFLPALWAAPIIARAPLAWELWRGPAADPEKGLYAALHPQMRSSDVFFSFVLAAALLLPCMMVFPKQIPHLLLAMGLCAFFSPLWHAFWRSQIGGLSGDVLGGAVELRQLLVFAVLALPL